MMQFQISYQRIITMLFKDQTIAFIHRSAETLKLTYQSTLQAVQLLNLLEAYASHPLNTPHQQHYDPTFATALLSLCCKLHEVKPVSIRELGKLIHPNYRHFDLQQLEKDEEQPDDTTDSHSLKQIESQIKAWELKIMLMVKWKLSVPLLYDEVIKIAFQWDKYTSFLEEFPLRFETEGSGCDPKASNNHNFLASRVCVCMYNMSHLIRGTSLEEVSQKCRRLAVALFVVLIRKLMRQKYKLKQYMLSPKFSLEHMLHDFCKQELQIDLNRIKPELDSILSALQNYKTFKELSREKENKKGKHDKFKRKRPTASQKISEEKENYPYYITLGNKSKHKKRCGSQLNDKTKKNRSRSKMDKQPEIKEVKTYWLKDASNLLRDNPREPETTQKSTKIGKHLKESIKDIKQSSKDIKESSKDIKESYRDKQNKRSQKELLPEQNENSRQLKEKPRLMKPRGSVMKATNKKSNSTKSILSKNVSTLKYDSKATLQNPLKSEKLPFSRSRASKRSDKSQLNSKLQPCARQEDISTKSTYWLRSTALAKTEKKCTNSSTRMKLR